MVTSLTTVLLFTLFCHLFKTKTECILIFNFFVFSDCESREVLTLLCQGTPSNLFICNLLFMFSHAQVTIIKTFPNKINVKMMTDIQPKQQLVK